METTFRVDGKEVRVYAPDSGRFPVVYLNTDHGEGEYVYEDLKGMDLSPFGLATVSDIDWESEMVPWSIPDNPLTHTPYKGEADAYLKQLTREIMPEVEARLCSAPLYSAIAGYSLGGLFAVYSLYETDKFKRCASASGSFWFPGFLDFVKSHKMKSDPQCIYLSIGDKESRTRNKVIATAEGNTEWLTDFFRGKGIDAFFEENSGNHFSGTPKRMAKGIEWILNWRPGR